MNRIFTGIKRKNLLAVKIPDDLILRQIKDTQYIAKRTKEELNKIFGNANVHTTTGGVTDYLKNHWGLTDKFKMLLRDRYETLLNIEKVFEDEYKNYLTQKKEKQIEYEQIGKEFKDVILNKDQFIELLRRNAIQIKNNKLIIKDWNKRIDHRHHAIDALVVACTEQSHIKRLNDLNKELQDWLDNHKQEILPDFEGTPSELLDEIMNLEESQRLLITNQLNKFTDIPAPWEGFDFDVENAVEEIIISQKPKDKLIIQKGKDGKSQIKIRGQLHEGTLYGKTQNAECYRIPIEKLAVRNFATEKTIAKIVNPHLKKVISKHLENYGNNKEEAFSSEGQIELNKLIAPHPPISKIKIFYQDPLKKRKTNDDEEGNDTLQRLDRSKAFNKSLFVKTGDNYLFAVMEKEKQDEKENNVIAKRCYGIVTFFDAANLLKTSFNKASNKDDFNKNLLFKQHFEEKYGAKLLFTLKQGDLVYLPDKNEEVIHDAESPLYNDFWKNYKERSKNIYLVQKFSGNEIYFLKHNIAKSIKKGIEFGTQDCYQNIGGRSIKEYCIKITVDRLGNISL